MGQQGHTASIESRLVNAFNARVFFDQRYGNGSSPKHPSFPDVCGLKAFPDQVMKPAGGDGISVRIPHTASELYPAAWGRAARP